MESWDFDAMFGKEVMEVSTNSVLAALSSGQPMKRRELFKRTSNRRTTSDSVAAAITRMMDNGEVIKDGDCFRLSPAGLEKARSPRWGTQPWDKTGRRPYRVVS